MATEIQLIPMQELSTGQASNIRNAAIAAVVAKAARELSIPADKLLVRDIRPKEDLGYAVATWYERTGATSGTYEEMTTSTGMADDRYVGLYGVKDDSTATYVTKLRIKVGNSIKAIWQLEGLYSQNGEGPRIGFCHSVVIIPQNTPYTIDRYVNDANMPAQIVLKGFVVERIGKVMSP